MIHDVSNVPSRPFDHSDWLTYRVLGGFAGKEQKRADDVTSRVCHKHHRGGDTLLGKASDVGSDHGQGNWETSSERDKDPEAEELTTLVGTVANKKRASQTVTVRW